MCEAVKKYGEAVAYEKVMNNKIESVKSLMKNAKWNIDQAMDALDIKKKNERKYISAAILK